MILSSISRAFRRFFNLDRRYGLRFDNGHRERTGFMTQEHAEGWAADHLVKQFVVFHYDPIDLRLPGISHPGRDSYRP